MTPEQYKSADLLQSSRRTPYTTKWWRKAAAENRGGRRFKGLKRAASLGWRGEHQLVMLTSPINVLEN